MSWWASFTSNIVGQITSWLLEDTSFGNEWIAFPLTRWSNFMAGGLQLCPPSPTPKRVVQLNVRLSLVRSSHIVIDVSAITKRRCWLTGFATTPNGSYHNIDHTFIWLMPTQSNSAIAATKHILQELHLTAKGLNEMNREMEVNWAREKPIMWANLIGYTFCTANHRTNQYHKLPKNNKKCPTWSGVRNYRRLIACL